MEQNTLKGDNNEHVEKHKQLLECQIYLLLLLVIILICLLRLFNFSKPLIIRHLLQLKAVVFLHRCLLFEKQYLLLPGKIYWSSSRLNNQVSQNV
jgi:hypothetical protein